MSVCLNSFRFCLIWVEMKIYIVAGYRKPSTVRELLMKKIICILIFTSFVVPLVSHAQQSAEIDKDLENISGQYAECAAYYEFAYYALKSSGDAVSAEAYYNLEGQAMYSAYILASEGRDDDMALNVTNSRIDMYKKKMRREANNTNANISILINKYHYDCEKIMQILPAREEEVHHQSK